MTIKVKEITEYSLDVSEELITLIRDIIDNITVYENVKDINSYVKACLFDNIKDECWEDYSLGEMNSSIEFEDEAKVDQLINVCKNGK